MQNSKDDKNGSKFVIPVLDFSYLHESNKLKQNEEPSRYDENGIKKDKSKTRLSNEVLIYQTKPDSKSSEVRSRTIEQPNFTNYKKVIIFVLN